MFGQGCVSDVHARQKLEWTMSAIGVYRKCLLSLFVKELIAAMPLFVLKQRSSSLVSVPDPSVDRFQYPVHGSNPRWGCLGLGPRQACSSVHVVCWKLMVAETETVWTTWLCQDTHMHIAAKIVPGLIVSPMSRDRNDLCHIAWHDNPFECCPVQDCLGDHIIHEGQARFNSHLVYKYIRIGTP